MTVINGDANHNKEQKDQYDYAIAALEDEVDDLRQIPEHAWSSPSFARRRIMQMAGELEAVKELVRHMRATLRAYEAELGRPLAPPPEVKRAMSITSSGMRPIAMVAGGRRLVVVAPPEGFADPEGTWRNIVGHYGDRGGG